MNNAITVGNIQGVSDLIEQTSSIRKGPRSSLDSLSQIPIQPAHHQISTFGVTPIIIERDNMGMFEAGNQLRFNFKTANKIRFVGILGQNDFNRNLAPDNFLISTIN